MKQKGFSNILIIGIIVAIVVLGTAGYLISKQLFPKTPKAPAEGQSTESQKTPTPEKSTSPTPTVTNITPAKESIEDILAKIENLGSVQYEVVVTTSVVGGSTTVHNAKVWEEKDYVRVEESSTTGTMILIGHPDAIYLYDVDSDKYLRMAADEGETTKSSLEEFRNNILEEIRKNTAIKEFGTEVIDGKLTTIIEYSTVDRTLPTTRFITSKVWLWNDKGVPLKIERNEKMGDYVFVTTEEYKKFVFGDIPDNIFAVPKNKVIESLP